jgi:hypothetical protein
MLCPGCRVVITVVIHDAGLAKQFGTSQAIHRPPFSSKFPPMCSSEHLRVAHTHKKRSVVEDTWFYFFYVLFFQADMQHRSFLLALVSRKVSELHVILH